METISEVISIRTWTSIASLVVLLPAVSSGASAQILDDPEVSGEVPDTGFVIPEYETPREIVFEFALPFLLISLILNIGLKQTLFLTTVEPDETMGQTLMNELMGNTSSRAKTASRRARILSLIITGMLVPTNVFDWVNYLVGIVFGGAAYIFVILLFGIFFWSILNRLRN